MTRGLRGVVQAEWKHRQGTPGEVSQGERLSPCELGCDIGEGEDKVVHIFPRWSGPKEGVELALEPPVVEVAELVAPGGLAPWRMQP